MSFLNASEPLGLPRGSGRLIMALMITGVFCYRFAVGAPVDPTLTLALGAVLAFYYPQRAKETDGKPVEDRLPEPVDGSI